MNWRDVFFAVEKMNEKNKWKISHKKIISFYGLSIWLNHEWALKVSYTK